MLLEFSAGPRCTGTVRKLYFGSRGKSGGRGPAINRYQNSGLNGDFLEENARDIRTVLRVTQVLSFKSNFV